MSDIAPALFSPESESAIIGAALISPQMVREELDHLLPAHFYLQKNQWIWQAMRDAWPQIDVLIVERALGPRMAEAGGPAYLLSCMAEVPTSLHAERYAQDVIEHFIRRRKMALAGELAKSAHNGSRPEDARAIAAALDDLHAPTTGFVDAYAAADHWYTGLEAWVKEKRIPGVATGFRGFDLMTMGLARREETIIASRPSMGKTAFAAQCSGRQLAAGLRVFVATLESSVGAWLARRVLADLNLDYRRINLLQLRQVRERVTEYAHAPNARYYDTGNVPAETIAAMARRAAREMGGLDCIWIDHMSYVAHPSRGDNVAYAIGRSNKVFTQLAKDLDCALVLLCQMNREAAKTAREPELHDLRESGELEQDGRKVIFIHRPGYYQEIKPPVEQAQEARMLVRKSHDGPVGMHPMMFVPASGLFTEVSK